MRRFTGEIRCVWRVASPPSCLRPEHEPLSARPLLLVVRLGGLLRLAREHFQVQVLQWGAVIAPALHYYADPFVIVREGVPHLFFEDYSYLRDMARICTMPLGGTPRVALERPYHLSYPFLVEDGGVLYMVPETCRNSTIEIYRCTGLADRWEPCGVLMRGGGRGRHDAFAPRRPLVDVHLAGSDGSAEALHILLRPLAQRRVDATPGQRATPVRGSAVHRRARGRAVHRARRNASPSRAGQSTLLRRVAGIERSAGFVRRPVRGSADAPHALPPPLRGRRGHRGGLPRPHGALSVAASGRTGSRGCL